MNIQINTPKYKNFLFFFVSIFKGYWYEGKCFFLEIQCGPKSGIKFGYLLVSDPE